MLSAHSTNEKSFRWDHSTYRQYLPYLTRFLSTLLHEIGRAERKLATARYIEGLLMPGRGKLIRPLAERLGVDPQSLQQAVTNSRWDESQLWSAMRAQVIPLLEPLPQWFISERSWEKQGDATVGVANQRCGAQGKSLHCQISLEILGSNGSIAAPLASRLFLPEEWANDSARRQRAEIPEKIAFLSKSALALELVREIVQDGMVPGMIQGDSTYGNDREFRMALTQQHLEFLLEVDGSSILAWDFESQNPDSLNSVQPRTQSLDHIVRGIAPAEWRRCSWTNEQSMARRTRLGFREVFVDPGPCSLQGNLEKLLLVVDWPENSDSPYRLYLANWRTPRTEAQCLRYSRYVAYREHYRNHFETVLDLGNYQGRSWKGFHRHLVMAVAAYLFVLTVEQRSKAAFWSDLTDSSPIDAAIAAETHRLAGILLRSGAARLSPEGPAGTPLGGDQSARQSGNRFGQQTRLSKISG